MTLTYRNQDNQSDHAVTHQCQYCKKEFVKESSIAVHLCEPKRRYLSRDDRGVQLGLQAYLQFYKTAAGSAHNRTFETFIESTYYRAFVKFGRYCVETRSLNPSRFIDWLLKHNKKIDNWCSDKIYTEYLIDYLRTEHESDALLRAIEYGIDWANKNSAADHDCLRYGNTNLLCHAITTGRISPWVIYNCDSGRQFLSGLNVEQLAMIWQYIDSDVWQKKFQADPTTQTYVQTILAQAGW